MGTGPKAFMRTKLLSFILHLYFPKSLIIQSAGYSVKQLFRKISSKMAASVDSLNSYD